MIEVLLTYLPPYLPTVDTRWFLVFCSLILAYLALPSSPRAAISLPHNTHSVRKSLHLYVDYLHPRANCGSINVVPTGVSVFFAVPIYKFESPTYLYRTLCILAQNLKCAALQQRLNGKLMRARCVSVDALFHLSL